MLHRRLTLKTQISSMCGEHDKFGAGQIERLERWSGRWTEATSFVYSYLQLYARDWHALLTVLFLPG